MSHIPYRVSIIVLLIGISGCSLNSTDQFALPQNEQSTIETHVPTSDTAQAEQKSGKESDTVALPLRSYDPTHTEKLTIVNRRDPDAGSCFMFALEQDGERVAPPDESLGGFDCPGAIPQLSPTGKYLLTTQNNMLTVYDLILKQTHMTYVIPADVDVSSLTWNNAEDRIAGFLVRYQPYPPAKAWTQAETQPNGLVLTEGVNIIVLSLTKKQYTFVPVTVPYTCGSTCSPYTGITFVDNRTIRFDTNEPDEKIVETTLSIN